MSRITNKSFLSGGSRVVLVALVRRNSSRRHKVRLSPHSVWITVNGVGIPGRWPEKSVRYITRLLKNAESNADAKNIDVEDLLIKSIVVQQAPVRVIVPFLI